MENSETPKTTETKLNAMDQRILDKLKNNPTPKTVMLTLANSSVNPILKAAALEAARKLGLNKK